MVATEARELRELGDRKPLARCSSTCWPRSAAATPPGLPIRSPGPSSHARVHELVRETTPSALP